MEDENKYNRFKLEEILTGKFFEREFFVKNKLLMFVVFLMLVANISVRYKAAKVLREVDKLEKDVKELRAHSISVASDIIKLTRPSEILDRIKNNNLGLEASKVPPRRIYVDKE